MKMSRFQVRQIKLQNAVILAMVFCALALLLAVPFSQALAQTANSDTKLIVNQPENDTSAENEGIAQTAEQRLANVELSVKAKLQYDGWQTPKKDGETVGTKTKQGLRMVRIKLKGLNGVSGSVNYQTYVPGHDWSSVAKNGKASGSKLRAITALRVKLKGEVSKYYDVYYRTYFNEIGWLDWAKNNQVSGTKSSFGYVSAVQIKLVKKTVKFKGKTKTHYVKNRWTAIEFTYRDKSTVRQLLEVKHTRGSKAQVVLRKKVKSGWKTVLSCKGYVGSAGIGSAREYYPRTPSGDFGITEAFGIKDDPGAKLNYVKVTQSMYWCSDRFYYNELIDINNCPHDCSGEHLIEYSPHYDYGLFFDYNTNPVRYGKGSAFFVHCTGGAPYTAGCIAVSKNNMKKIIRNVSEGARICIYEK